MGLLYDVFYPHSKASDREVNDRYLDKLAADAVKNRTLIGARAVCKNGEPQTIVLRDGADGPEWKDA